MKYKYIDANGEVYITELDDNYLYPYANVANYKVIKHGIKVSDLIKISDDEFKEILSSYVKAREESANEPAETQPRKPGNEMKETP